MKCCICDEEIEVHPSGWAEGNNAEPVVKEGRCCDRCNREVVIPRRIAIIEGKFSGDDEQEARH